MILLIPVISCQNRDQSITNECDKIAFNDGLFEVGPEDPGTTIQSYSIADDCLELVLGYSGGCLEHDIQLAARGWIYTLPVQVDARIIHDNQDACEAWLRDTLKVDLGPLRYNDDEKLIINLRGLDQAIIHSFID